MGDAATLAGLFVCGLFMGAVNNLAGAAGALGLVGLETLGGLDTTHANISLRPAAIAIGISGLIGFRSRGVHIPSRAWGYGALAVPGAALGGYMALELPIWVYRLTLAVVLIAVLAQQLTNRHPAGSTTRSLPAWLKPLLFVFVGLHMGFVQVATGLVSILVLTAIHSRDLISVNAAKMALVICSSVTANLVLGLAGEIVWVPAMALAVGCGVGSFGASRWSVDKGHGAVRLVVVGIAVAVLARLVWQVATGA